MTAQRAIWSASVRCRYQVMSVCQCNSCNTLPHRLGAVGSGTPATHCHTAWGQWAVQLLQRTALLHGGIGLQCTAPLPGGSGQWNSCNSLPHCLGVVGNGTPATHCHTAWGQWAVELLQRTALLHGGSGQWNSCNALSHRLGAVGSGTPAMRGPIQGVGRPSQASPDRQGLKSQEPLASHGPDWTVRCRCRPRVCGPSRACQRSPQCKCR